MIKILKNDYLESQILKPFKQFHLGKDTGYILDNNLNCYLKLKYSDSQTSTGRQKFYSIIPISQNELNDIRGGIISIDAILEELLSSVKVSYKLTEFYSFEDYNTQVSIESYIHN